MLLSPSLNILELKLSMSFDDTNDWHRAYDSHSRIIVSIACRILNPSVLGVPYIKMNSGFAQSSQIFLIFQSSNCFNLLKVSPKLAKILSNDQFESAQLI